MTHRTATLLAIAAASAALPAQSGHLMTAKSTIPLTPCTTGDVWALSQRHMLIARRSAGFAVVDTDDPSNPVVATVTPPGYPASSCNYGVGDIKSDGRYIYATNEYSGGGVFLYDAAANPMSPAFVHHLQHTRVSRGVHNCWIDGNTLYCVSNGTRLIEVFDVSNKAAPVWLSSLGAGIANAGAHDVIVLDDRAYCSLWGAGFAIYDVKNPAAPTLLAHQPYPGAACHNCWPTEDRRYLYTTDETVLSNGEGGFVRVWDIQSLGAISEVGKYKAPGQIASIVHNVHVRGDYLFISYYKEGVRVCSIRNDPKSPVELGWFDAYAPAGGGCFTSCYSWGGSYAGCWGVYAWNNFDIFMSDMDSGGYVLTFTPVSHSLTAKATTVPRGGTLDLAFSYRNDTVATVSAIGVVAFTSLNGSPLFSPIWLGFGPLSPSQTTSAAPIQIPIPLGIPPLTVGVTGYSGLLDPTLFTDPTELTITIQ